MKLSLLFRLIAFSVAGPLILGIVLARHRQAALGAPPDGYTEVGAAAGLSFVYDNDETPDRRFIETTGGGVALLDYDRDGRTDLFAVQGGPAPGNTRPRPRPPHALYRNLGALRFRDATRDAGLAVETGYGQGASAADYDGDGWTDLLITGYGGIRLFRNLGGRFADRTREVGLLETGEPHWSTSAAWADYDRDGWPDLFVCRYVSWFPDVDRPCVDSRGERMYCRPTEFVGDRSVLYRNLRGRRFQDVSASTGIGAHEGRALGALWLDANEDGWPDLFVANDLAPNWLFLNRGGRGFDEQASAAGAALGPDGHPLSGMGVASADWDGNGREDLFVTNFSLQPRSLFLGVAPGEFRWGAARMGLGGASQKLLGWGAEPLDLDLDGWEDLVVANGHLHPNVERFPGGVRHRQPMELLRNREGREFRPDPAAGEMARPRFARGLAVGDLNDDGSPEVVVSGPGERLALFTRERPPAASWIGFRLEPGHGRTALGAVVEVRTGAALSRRRLRAGSSYLSCSEPRLLFGLGRSRAPVEVAVTWPSGVRVEYGPRIPGRYHELRQPPPPTSAAPGRP